MRLVIMLFVCADLSAQTLRLHDAERARISREAAEAFRSPNADISATMLANLDAIDERDLRLLADRNQATLEATVANLPMWTWSRFAQQARDTAKSYEEAAGRAILLTAASREALPPLGQTLARARAAATQAAQRQRTLEEQLTARLATVDEFRKAIDILRNPRVGAITDIPPAAKRLLENLQASDNARGLQLRFLELAHELADVEVARIRENIRQERLQLEQSRDLAARIEGVTSSLAKSIAFAEKQPQQTSIAQTIRDLAQAAQRDPLRESALREALEHLFQFTSAIGSERLHVMQSEVLAASAEQRAAIMLSAINLRERGILVEHGLESLETYYAGGIAPAQLANVFRAAQIIALAVIARRID